MNTYYKFAPNVFLAECSEKHEKGSVVPVTTKYGKENPCIIWNLISEKNEKFYYSITRDDGMDSRDFAKKRAGRLHGFAENAEKRSDDYFEAATEGIDFLALGEPIKVGHHSEGRHRALIARNHNRLDHAIQEMDKSTSYQSRAKFWEAKTETINLSMPECLEVYAEWLDIAKAKHAALKDGTIKPEHGYSLAYAKKHVKKLEADLEMARRLWA